MPKLGEKGFEKNRGAVSPNTETKSLREQISEIQKDLAKLGGQRKGRREEIHDHKKLMDEGWEG